MAEQSIAATRVSEESSIKSITRECLKSAYESTPLSAVWGFPVSLDYQIAEVMPGLYGVVIDQALERGSRERLYYGCIYQGISSTELARVDGDFLPQKWPDQDYSPSNMRQRGGTFLETSLDAYLRAN